MNDNTSSIPKGFNCWRDGLSNYGRGQQGVLFLERLFSIENIENEGNLD